MKIVVCGSVGYGGIEKIRELQEFLRREGYDVLDQFEKADYSYVDDFRDKDELCEKIVKNDMSLIEKADVLILVADHPSFGSAIEAYTFSMSGKPVIAYAESNVRSPWPLFFARRVCKDKKELVGAIGSFEGGLRIKGIPNVYGDHEAEFAYENFRCLCPVTGEEDRAKILVRYKPGEWLLEYECLRDYFGSFEGRAIHHEGVVDTIFNDIYKALKPKWLEVEAEFEERSGVRAKVRKTSVSSKETTGLRDGKI
jgi:7-cyano-7-deazaguanine reductase